MKKNILFRTNLFICSIIVLGFVITSLIGYRTNDGLLKKDVEHISGLTSEGIYHQIDSIFTKPINISLTMANDSLLKTFLQEEESQSGNEDFILTMRDYLLSYKEKYDYDSVFLVSTATDRYYHFAAGVDRILTEGDPENVWYYSFLESPAEYNLNIDNDQVKEANNEINIFINCKIYAPDGAVLGIVGVGFGVDTLQKIFQDYEERFHLRAYLVDEDGTIEISTTQTGYVKTDLFADCGYEPLKGEILSDLANTQSHWYSAAGKEGFLVSSYIPNLGWHLIIDNDISSLQHQLNLQFLIGILVTLLVVGLVLFIITRIIRKYNAQLIQLTVEKEKSHQTAFQAETEKLYENIYELDITHNCAASEATEHYFESLGVSKDLPYDETLKVIADKQIKEEYRAGYLSTFSPANVLKAWQEGQDRLHYDFMTTADGGCTYYWMRITARIFFWKEDQSVRMLIYRQNIEKQKQQEEAMAVKIREDSLTGLYNKAATQEAIQTLLSENPGKAYAFFMLDIDNFKSVNDTYGHALGDLVITDFATRLKQQFREKDIVGRVGGDEFAVFVPTLSKDWMEKKAAALAAALQYEFSDGHRHCSISASIGVCATQQSVSDFETLYQNADRALYQTKRNGKRGYSIA